MRVKVFHIVFLFVLVLTSCKEEVSNDPETPKLTEIQKRRIDSVCKGLLERGNTLGFSVAITKGDELVFAKGYGLANKDNGKMADSNTIYPIASISKFLTAMATMKLVEQEKISLDDKLHSYFDNFPRQEYMEDITIEHLLRHQSGIIDHEDWFDSIYINEKRVFTQDEFFEFIDQPLFFEPGTHYLYSNSGYALLSSVLEKVTGKDFHESIQDLISVPHEVESIGMWPVMWDHKDATMGYELIENKLDTSFHMMTKGMKGDGGLSASVVDLVKVVTDLDKGRIISESSLERMLSKTTVGSIQVDFGLGLKMGYIEDQFTYGHSGGYKGTGWAIVSRNPESDITFAAAMNTNFSPEEVWTIRHEILPLVLEISKPEHTGGSLEDGNLYVGEYASINRWGDSVASRRIVAFENGKLTWDNPDTETPGAQLFPVSEHTFSFNPYPFDRFLFHVVDDRVVACSQYADGFFTGVKMKTSN